MEAYCMGVTIPRLHILHSHMSKVVAYKYAAVIID